MLAPIRVRYDLYQHPAAPVIRTELTIYDKPDMPLGLETFTNIDDSQQRSEFAPWRNRRNCCCFYDEALIHRLIKVVPQNNLAVISEIVSEADRLFGEMDIETYDIERAKAAVIAATTL